MEELLEILNDINPDVDYSKEKNLIDGKVYDSFSIITLVSNISEEFDSVYVHPQYSRST